jgi:hypothetical protein
VTDAVAHGATATAPVERGWRWFVLAIALMVAISLTPLWPPALALVSGLVRLLLPVEQFAVLVLVAIASCAIVGWWAGGRLGVALFWTSVAGVLLWKVPLPSNGYGAFTRGWAMVLGASFGLVCFATASRPFLSRAIAAVSLAGVVTILGLAGRSAAGSGVFDASSQMMGFEYQRRVDEALSAWRRRTDSQAWQSFARGMPDVAARAERSASVVASLGRGPSSDRRSPSGSLLVLAPALLALESVLALALGWASYHRLSRARIGPPLGTVRVMRFNDQWIWGLVVGITLLLLPTLVEWRSVGMNVVVFFGTLYMVRGVGVLLWWIPDRWAWLLPVALVVLIPLLGPVRVLAALAALTFGIGLSDTWRDFRSSAVTRRPESRT